MGLSRWNEEQAYGRLFLILFLHRNNKGVCWISGFLVAIEPIHPRKAQQE